MFGWWSSSKVASYLQICHPIQFLLGTKIWVDLTLILGFQVLPTLNWSCDTIPFSPPAAQELLGYLIRLYSRKIKFLERINIPDNGPAFQPALGASNSLGFSDLQIAWRNKTWSLPWKRASLTWDIGLSIFYSSDKDIFYNSKLQISLKIIHPHIYICVLYMYLYQCG